MKILKLVAMVLIQRKGENDGGEGETVMGWPLRETQGGEGCAMGGELGGRAVLGFRLFRYLALRRSALALALAHLLKPTKGCKSLRVGQVSSLWEGQARDG